MCFNDHFEEHPVFIGCGAYKFQMLSCRNVACVNDDGIVCACGRSHHADLFPLLVSAMEREVRVGIFEVADWAPTFPRRTAELVAMRRERVAAALAGELPVVLIGVVCDFIF